VEASSIEINKAVSAHSANGEPVYKLDDEVISQLDPDLIIAQDHCRVCAITPGDISNSTTCSKIRQLIVKPSTLEDCLKDITTIANGMGYPERGIALKKTLEMRMDRVRETVAFATSFDIGQNSSLSQESTASVTAKPRVALLEWCDPIMGCGYWLPELVKLAGGEAMHCPPPGGATPTISFQSLIESKPDVVVFALCGFNLKRAAREIVNSWGMHKLEKLMNDGVSGGRKRVFVVDGNYLVNRSGPRLIESAEALAEAIHPALLGHFGHFGTDLMSTMDDILRMMKIGQESESYKIRLKSFEEKSDADQNNSKEKLLLPSTKPQEAVSMQLEYLQNGNLVNAFAVNSKANQMRWCSPDRFAAVLKSHGDFCRLLSEPAKIGEIKETSGRIATVRVILDEQGDLPLVELLWTMVAEVPDRDNKMVWRTEKVGPAH